MKKLAIAIAGVLAAPVVMANCDTHLDRIEARVEAADMEPRNEQVLIDWLKQQRVEHAGSTAAQCSQLVVEIERQMKAKGYFASADQTQPWQSGTAQTSTLEAGQAGIAVEAAPAEVMVQQPAAQIDVQQRPAEVEVEMQQAEILVQVPDPQVQVTQPPPQVTVNQPDPKVRVVQNEPMVSIDQPDPEVTVTQGEPEVTVQQGEPQVSVHEQPAIVDVQQGDPQVEVQQANGGNVAVGATVDDSDYVAAGELLGHTVVDSNGATVGRVTEALKRPHDGRVFVRVDVAATSELGREDLLLGVDRLERNAGNLLVRGEPSQVLGADADLQVDELESADSEQVVLSGEW